MVDVLLVLLAVLPPLLLLVYYYSRIPTTISLMRLLSFFALGAISGFIALHLELVFETVAQWVVNWRVIQRSLFGVALRQLIEVGPIEEGCKLVTVIALTNYFQRRYRLRPSTVFLFCLAVSLGFTAEENWVYLFHGFQGIASIVERLISTPVHAMFSAPWGYALGMLVNTSIYSNRRNGQVSQAWLNSVICHALVNVLSISGRYSFPWNLLSYGLFPFLLWMFWRLEQYLQKVQGQVPRTLISGSPLKQQLWREFLMLLTLMLGGNAIFVLFTLTRDLSFLNRLQLLDTNVALSVLSRLSLGLILGLSAWVIYRYLRRLTSRRRYY
ncbi:PrsW family intramembrane metalloprotease [Scytonema sp. UIC 10036]|uniref:PrsW family glutamic-type intramembrane protease n=1 Tax=Scytonema sp. UIC 10036 TaxID=2304196 RepID=UPI00137FDB80|nr:PrsW family intramembrane metalloprotease [Scytonema sp. UIC 10036]